MRAICFPRPAIAWSRLTDRAQFATIIADSSGSRIATTTRRHAMIVRSKYDSHSPRRLAMTLWLTLIAAMARAEDATVASREEFFESRIRPVLVEQCFRCHGGASTEQRLRVDSR